jgi:uncharacterized protein (TIGR02996 family)
MTPDEAFFQAILDSPDDDTPRLVYADWLEEQGDPRGEFIRLQCLLAKMANDDPARRETELRAWLLFVEVLPRCERSIRDRAAVWSYCRRLMTGDVVDARVYLEHHALFELAGIRPQRVDLSSATVPRSVLDLVPESVARENLLLPLAQFGFTLVIALPDPDDAELLAKLVFILDRDLAPVRADRSQLVTAIDRYYGPADQ